MDADIPAVAADGSYADKILKMEQEISNMSSLKARLQKICESDDLTDVRVLLVDESKKTVGTFWMHQIFAETASPVLSKMFVQAEMEGQNFQISGDAKTKKTFISITLEDMSSSTFLQLKRYIYTNHIPAIGKDCALGDILELRRKGEELQVAGLTESISDTVVQVVDTTNAVAILNHGCRWDDSKLIGATLKIIAKNAQDFLSSPDFLELDEKSLIRVLQLDDLEIRTETELYDTVKKWGINKCIKKHLDPDEIGVLRKELVNVIGLIRFPVMDKQEFATKVAVNNKILNSDDMISILIYFLAEPENRANIPKGRFNSKMRKYLKPIADVPVKLTKARKATKDHLRLVNSKKTLSQDDFRLLDFPIDDAYEDCNWRTSNKRKVRHRHNILKYC